MSGLADLWAGRLPLATAFWTWSVLIGVWVNGAATVGALAVVASDLPAALALGAHLSPLPFNVACIVGVWRSAARYGGASHWADAARFAVVVWAILLTAV